MISKKTIKSILDFAGWAVFVGGAVFLFSKVLFLNAIVPSGSMEETIPTYSYMICWRLAYKDNSPQRGDIIVFNRSMEDDERVYTKRVVGLPGETVEIKNGQTYINGNYLPETYLKEEPQKVDFGPFVVPEEKYFCMGDNRNNSFDCRYWDEHYVDGEKILAKAKFLVFTIGDKPFEKTGVLEEVHYE